MSFGCSVGDFVALGNLAWKIYKACKDAPEGFKNISQEVLSLHAVLKEVEETYSDATLSAAQRSRQRIIGDGCRGVLEDLQSILDRYNSLGTKTKSTWDRLGWGSEGIAELRSRLISNTVLLATFVNTSQVIVQKKLDAFIQEFRDGKREGSVVCTQTVDSLSTDENQAWQAIRKELEDVGVSVAAFDANKDFIVNWFKVAMSTGAFEEQPAEDGSSSILCDDDFGQRLEDMEKDTLLSQSLEDPGHDPTLTTGPVDHQPLQLLPDAKPQRGRPPRVASLVKLKLLFRADERLFKAVQSADESKIRRLLKKDVDVNIQNSRKRTALHLAVLKNYGSIVQLLLENGANVHEVDMFGHTALHLAVSGNSGSIVQLLLENGANVDERDKNGSTALHLAAEAGHETVVQLLLKNGAKINETRIYRGDTALHIAVRERHELVVKLLLEQGANVDQKERLGVTALHWATKNEHEMEMVVQLLLQHAAKIDERDVDGYTALHWAAKVGHKMVLQLLLENGAKINEIDNKGRTALHLAAKWEHEAVVQILLKHGAKIDIKTGDGLTALEVAIDNGNFEVEKILRNAGGSK